MPPNDGVKGVKVRFIGRVQGVWFRAWTAEQAASRGVEGWVRNLYNGDVEAVFVGPDEAVEALIEDCRGGPPLARVDDVQFAGLSVEDTEALIGGGFVQRPTA